MRRFTLSVSLPGSRRAYQFTLRGARRAVLAREAAFILLCFAQSRGVSPFALDYSVRA